MSPRSPKPVQKKEFASPTEALEWVGREIAGLIRMKSFQRSPALIGLAPLAGHEPLRDELVAHSGVAGQGGLDYRKVEWSPCLELVGRAPAEPGSATHWLRRELLEPTGTLEKNLHAFDGTLADDALAAHAEELEQRLPKTGLSIAVLTLGPRGEIGLLPPAAGEETTTGVFDVSATELEPLKDVLATDGVTRVLHVGLATLLRSERIRLLALEHTDAALIGRVCADEPDPDCPASRLFGHKDCQVMTVRG